MGQLCCTELNSSVQQDKTKSSKKKIDQNKQLQNDLAKHYQSDYTTSDKNDHTFHHEQNNESCYGSLYNENSRFSQKSVYNSLSASEELNTENQSDQQYYNLAKFQNSGSQEYLTCEQIVSNNGQQSRNSRCSSKDTCFYSISQDSFTNDFAKQLLKGEGQTIDQHNNEEKLTQVDSLTTSKENSQWGSSETDQKKFDLVIQQFSEELQDWKLAYSQSGCMNIYKKQAKDSQSILVRSETNIPNCSVEDLFQQYYQSKNRQIWDTLLVEIHQVKIINQNTDIYYYIMDASKTLSKREWLLRRVIKKNFPSKGDISIVEYSIENNYSMSNNKSIVRAQCNYIGYMLQQEESDVRMQIVSDNDIKGDIPKFIVNSFVEKGTKNWINNLIKSVQNIQISN